MPIPTEPIGSIPRPIALIEAIKERGFNDPALDPLFDEAIRDTIARFEATGSPVITDGEQRKYHNFGTYCVDGLPNIAPDGFKIPFLHHTRQWPRLTRGPPLAGSVTYPANTAGPPIARTPTSPGVQSVHDPSSPMCTAFTCWPARARPTDPVRSPPGGVKVVAQVASVRP